MTKFEPHKLESSSGERKETLETIRKNYGFIPNLLSCLSEAPSAARAYMALGAEVAQISLAPEELNIAWIAVVKENDCAYCLPAHSLGAERSGIDREIIIAAKSGGGFDEPRQQILHDFVTEVVRQRGKMSRESIDRFISAGFTKQQVLEVVLIVTHKTLSNYANHIMETPLDDILKPYI